MQGDKILLILEVNLAFQLVCKALHSNKSRKNKQSSRKSRERVGREKGKKDHMYQLRYLLLACCSPLN